MAAKILFWHLWITYYVLTSARRARERGGRRGGAEGEISSIIIATAADVGNRSGDDGSCEPWIERDMHFKVVGHG